MWKCGRNVRACACILLAICFLTSCSPSAPLINGSSPSPQPTGAESPLPSSKPTQQASSTAVSSIPSLLPFELDGKFGYIDRSGKVIIKPMFVFAKDFSEGLAAVSMTGHETNMVYDANFGYIDEKGNYQIEPQFDNAMSFQEGLAVVRVGDSVGGKYGYINKEGKFVINPQFKDARSFSEELAAVSIDGKYGYIDHSGNVAIKPEFDDAFSFSNGLACVQVGFGDGSRFGFIDQKGKFVINPQFAKAETFSEGLVNVHLGTGDTPTWGYIDVNGDTVIDGKYYDARPFSEGLAAVQTSEHRTETATGWRYVSDWGFIDINGEMVIQPQQILHYSFGGGHIAHSFSDGLALVYTKDGFRYIDKTGSTIIKIDRHIVYAFDFANGLAKIATVRNMDPGNISSGYIDKNGKYILEPIWNPESNP